MISLLTTLRSLLTDPQPIPQVFDVFPIKICLKVLCVKNFPPLTNEDMICRNLRSKAAMIY